MISQARLRSLLVYDPDTGIFLRQGVRVGTPTKYRKTFYLKIRIDKRIYYAHRLAWLYMFGQWPKMIDHQNSDGTDNRLINLRECSRSENHANTNWRGDNTTGFKGVSRTKHGRFRATIIKNGKQFYLGTFLTAQAAHTAYIQKAKELFGQFANAGLLLLFLTSSAFSAPCLTRLEARDRWPSSHLFWHTENRCWDNRPKGAEHYDPRPQLKLVPPPLPNDVAAAPPPSGLERSTPKAPVAEIFYPELVKGHGLDVYPVLVWPQNWLSPDGAHNWPKLIDIDRVPFTAWSKRIGQ